MADRLRARSSLLQLRILLHQLLQTEARELYRNLRVFPIPLALIDRPFAVFRMLDLLPRTKSALAGGRFDRQLWELELFPARGKKLSNVVDRIVAPHRRGSLRLNPLRIPTRTLILVLVRIVSRFAPMRMRLGVWRGHSCPRKADTR